MKRYFYFSFLLVALHLQVQRSFAQEDSLYLLRDFCPGKCDGKAVIIGEFNKNLLIRNNSDILSFYLYDSTGQLKSITKAGLYIPSIANQPRMVIYGNTLYFCAYPSGSSDSIKLYSWDGNNIACIANRVGKYMYAPRAGNGKIYYATSFGTYTYDTATKINSLAFSHYINGEAVIYKDKFYHIDIDPVKGKEMFTTDIKTGEKSLLADIASGAKNSDPKMLQVIDDKLYFVALNTEKKVCLFQHDGSSEPIPIITLEESSNCNIVEVRLYAGKLYVPFVFNGKEKRYTYDLVSAEFKEDEVLSSYKSAFISSSIVYKDYLVLRAGNLSAMEVLSYNAYDKSIKKLNIENNATATLIDGFFAYKNGLYAYLQTEGTGMEIFRYEERIKIQTSTVLYPNPVTSTVNIRTGVDTNQKLSFALYDIAGRKVMNHSLGSYAKGNYEIPVSLGHLAAGVYICILRGYRGTIFTGKLVKL